MNCIGNNIKTYRKKKKITQKEMALHIDKSERTVQKYESGELEPNIETLNKIARALNVSILELIGNTLQTKQKSIEEIVKREIPDISQQDMEHIINEVMNFIQYELSKKLPQYKKVEN